MRDSECLLLICVADQQTGWWEDRSEPSTVYRDLLLWDMLIDVEEVKAENIKWAITLPDCLEMVWMK